MAGATAKDWNGDTVQTWLERRIVAARADQVVAERGGRAQQDDCDKATAEEMVCSRLLGPASTATAEAFLGVLKGLADRDEFIWRGVYDDTRFDRHVRSYIRRLVKMAKTNDGFDRIAHYQ